MKNSDLKTLEITFSSLATFLFFISGLYIVSIIWFIITAIFISQKPKKNK
ncbi:hypothetical protein SA19142_08220 [Staphylococcus argenteus]|nr:hypothetical protein SARG0275_16080 [Staphylococcus argenteus]GBU03022.1 hypothetical protein SARG0275_21030 [Staphylococcus argenteus]GJF35297.1 hypothetical protein SA19023_00520 [Staphylococcus argenteus]GJF69622.1 hypothetical protein SA19142_08220 [Staphylococcus argenteus]GJF80056.1 hypothetical protein SA19252_10190 [Staphylococcus argenteus]